jgi:hypothetical protein
MTSRLNSEKPIRPTARHYTIIIAKQDLSVRPAEGTRYRKYFRGRTKISVTTDHLHASWHAWQSAIPFGKPTIGVRDMQTNLIGPLR